jgi:sporulation protein YlmC with PRC-barrel domain
MNNPPVAEVRSRSSKLHQYFGGSSLWILTLLCLLVSAGLIWWSMPTRGTIISIRFPEGHGLQPEDTVRYRGIEVGTVESVGLDETLGEVDVHVLLNPSATQLATEGTRFWIVRPELSLTRISGLETAIGHKYIGVSPSTDADARTAHHFQGLADVPVDTLSDSGIELILRGDKRYGISNGSAVSFRGVEVGTVLDVALAKDGRQVHARVRIFDKYRDLLTSRTMFWATSGVDFDFNFGLQGSNFDLDTESLDTLFRGGVSMITPGQGDPVSPGDVFTLHASAEDEWLESAASFSPTSVVLRGALPVTVTWKPSGLIRGYLGEKSARCNGVALAHNGVNSVVFPADVIENAKDEKELALTVGKETISIEALESAASNGGLLQLETGDDLDAFDTSSDLTSMDQPLECLAVRQSGNGKTYFHMSIGANSIKRSEDAKSWDLIDFNGDRNVWHGAPVVTAEGGKLVGVLLILPRQTKIVEVGNVPGSDSN